MKNIAAIIFTLLALIACSKEKTETVKMGNKDSNLLEIKNFSESKKPKNIILAIADGAGLNHITVSRLAIGGPDHKLYIDQLPVAVLLQYMHMKTLLQTQPQQLLLGQQVIKPKIDIYQLIRIKKNLQLFLRC